MQTITKFTRKVLSQIITVYQGTLDIELPDIGLKLLIKPNKNVDDMLDVVNAKLIDVCGEYLEGKKLGLDKYQLATICAQLTTLAMEQCEEPFRVSIKTNKALIQGYLEKNKSKREALERIKKENESLDRETQALDQQLKEKQQQAKSKKVELAMKQEVPSGEDEVGALGLLPPVEKPAPKKKSKMKYRGTGTSDLLADDNFTFPGF